MSNDVTIENISSKKVKLSKKILNHLGKIGISAISATFVIVSAASTAPAVAPADAAKDVVGSESLNQAFKVARSKPALSIAAGITCVACMLAAGVGASSCKP